MPDSTYRSDAVRVLAHSERYLRRMRKLYPSDDWLNGNYLGWRSCAFTWFRYAFADAGVHVYERTPDDLGDFALWLHERAEPVDLNDNEAVVQALVDRANERANERAEGETAC